MFQLRRYRKTKNEWCRNGAAKVSVKCDGDLRTVFSISSLLSILMIEFWTSLEHDERKIHEISTKLVKWYENKKSELSELSWTCKLWFSYIKYIFIVQEFIWAERTNNWESLIARTISMLNLLAVTGHNNSAKQSGLYIQSVEELKSINLSLHNQFNLENHIVRWTGSNWSVIWVGLSIEQMLTKSLRRRSGIIRRGITENVMNVWTKIMHR